MRATCLVIFSALYLGAALAQSQTKSEEYSWLQTSSPRTAEFLSKSRLEVDAVLARNQQLPLVLARLLRTFPANVETVEELGISDTRKIRWSRRNFDDVFIDEESAEGEVIFSTASLKPRTAQPLGLSLSPSKRFVVLQLQLDGNIDVSHYVVYDLERRVVQGQFDGLSYLYSPAWSDADLLLTMHPSSSPRLTSVLSVDLTDMSSKTDLNRSLYKFNDWVAVTSPASKTGSLKNLKTGQSFGINTHITSFNDVEETKSAFFFILHEDNDGTVMRLKKVSGAVPEKFVPRKREHWLSSIQLLRDDLLLVNYSRDSRVTLALYDLKGPRLVSELRLPDNYDLVEAWAPQKGRLRISLSNFLGQTFEVAWSLATPEETDLSVLPQTFRLGDLEFISRLEEFPAHDGQRVPARILYLKDTALTGHNPAYIETYGAFNYISFYLTPQLDPLKLEFLKRGGILVGTGVRGGAERGYEWYLHGTGVHKATPAHDLIAIADGLVRRGYTTPKRIVSTGVSAGGDNVALAAQLSPKSFGLVVPISGIHDHLGYLHLDRWGPQWIRDYLNPYQSSDFAAIFARSPIEVRTKAPRYPQYLIVCGEEDSRVSKVHSYKLKASLDEFNPGNTFLHCVDHAGHWPNSSYTHGVQGIKTNAVIWAWVFDYLGLTI